ncbi:MAG: universal stress protein [Polyangiaceae bacterium]|nr:universal stress protein [Polyangiaceae bacterium]
MKTILVAIDGSEREQGVLDAAVALARSSGAKLLLFRSVGLPHGLPAPALTMTPDEVGRFLEDEARRALEARASELGVDLVAGICVVIGTAWQSILRAATQADAELIVIGSHGYSGIDHLLGTTAAKVVNHADRSVLVVRTARARGSW